ncbi:uncharacterized protein LOC132742506 [Ruditapes philippinarum]|uniref:uncharacterized protein LOC132742506 n=1 Tax=Ruditapes philippinarum TaxID=129788 RepID=UPI00295C1437|nr:uncharacterized protein LOC132742506 [Ruditapes philippinarum]
MSIVQNCSPCIGEKMVCRQMDRAIGYGTMETCVQVLVRGPDQSGVDYFGPWLIKEGRKELKRYGVVFTCFCCRAVHLETANSLTTDSFINALRRFLAVRGPVRVLRSDSGTNFVGAERELANALSEMDISQVHRFLQKESCDFIEFKMNVPNASNMGGVWEGQLRSVRSILSSLLYHHGAQHDDESLRTFMCETAAIINSRPLSPQNLNDPLSSEPLTSNHLLTMKLKLLLPPPDDNQPRCQWRMGRIVELYPDSDGLVRKVRLYVGTSELSSEGKRDKLSYLDRPVNKLIVLCENV